MTTSTKTDMMKSTSTKLPFFVNKKWTLVAILSIGITIYGTFVTISLTNIIPIILPEDLRLSFNLRPWAFYLHIIFGAIALTTGAINLNMNFLRRFRGLHKKFGLTYIVSIWISSLTGIYMGRYSAVGWVDHIGFMLLGIFWFVTTTRAYLLIRQKKIKLHREWIYRSFAITFAAVMLRVWMPILMISGFILGYTDPFQVAYPIVSFLCWVPNLLIVELIIRRSSTSKVNKLIEELTSV